MTQQNTLLTLDECDQIFKEIDLLVSGSSSSSSEDSEQTLLDAELLRLQDKISKSALDCYDKAKPTQMKARKDMAARIEQPIGDKLKTYCNTSDKIPLANGNDYEYAATIASYIYHGGGVLPYNGEVSEEGFCNKVVGFFGNVFSSGKHTFRQPIATQANADTKLATLVASAIEEVSTKIFS